MRVHVINLRSRADRRAQFSNWNARPSLELVFVDAAIGADIDPEGALGDGLVAARTRLTPGALVARNRIASFGVRSLRAAKRRLYARTMPVCAGTSPRAPAN